MKIDEATKGLEARIQGVEAQLKAQNWLIGSFGLIVAIATIAGALTQFIR